MPTISNTEVGDIKTKCAKAVKLCMPSMTAKTKLGAKAYIFS